MAVTVSWTPAFFSLEQLFVAFGIIVLLRVLVVATVIFRRVDRRAAALLVPYLV